MIAKVIAHGADRGEALARLRRALSESAVVLDGGTTNKAFLLELLDRPEVRSAQVDTGWLERWAAERVDAARPNADVALLAAAVEAYDDELRLEEEQFYESAARMRPEIRKEVGRDDRVPPPRTELPAEGLPARAPRLPRRAGRRALRGARRAALALRALARRGRDALPDPLRPPGPRLPRRGRRRAAPLLARRPRHPPRAVARGRRLGRRRAGRAGREGAAASPRSRR